MENELFARMQYEPCVFLFGNKYRTISTVVLEYAWKSVVTTNCEMSLAAALRNDNRSIKDVMALDDMQANLMDSKNLHVVRLFGELYPPDDLDDLDAEDVTDQAVAKLMRIAEVITRNGIVLVEDFEEKLFSHKEIRKAFRNLFENKRQIYIFNCREKDQYLTALEEKGIAVLIEHSINDFFAEYFPDDTDYEYEQEAFNNSVSVYINSEESLKPFSINKKDLVETESFAVLLNIEMINAVRIPSNMYEDYFYMFLKNSVREPQWYGYVYGFNIQRNYEETLYRKTKKGLENTGKRNNKPLLLVGQTGAGKSISLAALAYRIFDEKRYPVVYINNPDVNFSSEMEYKHSNVTKTGSAAFNALDSIIKNLENRGAKAVLLVWDTSSYSTGREKCYRLYQALLSRGRKVFLVSSAYELSNNKQGENEFDEDSVMHKKFVECKANIEVSDEKEKLRDILVNKCKMNMNSVNAIIGYYAGVGTNYLAMFYQAFDMIRGDLSKGVFREANANLKELDKMLEEGSTTDVAANNIFQIALKKIEDDLVNAGIVDELEDIEKVRKEKIEIAKDDFIKCIAVGSQFKLKMPYDFSLRILGTYDPHIIKTLTKSTFFVISQDIYENYEISIRTPLEASMYIQAKGMTMQDEIDCIVKVIDMMNPSGGYGQRQEVRFCERLVIIVGPNKSENKNKYKFGYEKIIAALKRLREERNIWDPSLISQEITYLREYYGANESLDLHKRIQALEEAVSIADEVLNKSEYSGINAGIRNAILVESSNSKLLLCQLRETNDSAFYKEIRRDLRTVIKYDNLNDYAYVALLKGSIIEYTNEHDSIKQLELLESMCTIADEIVFENPDIAGSEYFRRKVAEIYSFLDDTSVMEKYINELVANGSSAGLYVLARKMLIENQVDFRKPIKDAMQQSACEKVYSIFTEEKYKEVIEDSESCQYMLLNTIWLMNNKEPIYGQGECWTTRMRPEVWKEILALCNNFIIKFCSDGEYQRNLARNISYIKALCLGQIGDYSNSLLTLRTIKEDSTFGLGRVATKHMLCDEHGNIRKFTGRIGKYDETQRNGSIYIEEFGNTPIYYFGPHLKSSNLTEGTVFNDIEIGYSNIAPKAFRNIEAGD